MSSQWLLRILLVFLSASVYAIMPPQAAQQPERGPMQRKAIVRPPRQGIIPPTTAR